jgi:hypothetical protein
MNIDQLSKQIKAKTIQLNQQIAALEARQQAADKAQDPKLAAEIAALQELKAKLVKSGDIARRAYELQQGGSEEARLRQRRLAIGLCMFSGLGLLIIAGIFLFQ